MGEYFVKIKDSKRIRREVLEASKETLGLLFDYEKLKELRNERLEALNNSKELIKGMKLIIENIKKSMPKEEVSPDNNSEQKSKKKRIKEEIQETKENMPLTDLEKELAEIEKRIKSI